VIRIPTPPETVGDHIRKRRLGLKLLQREATERMGVCETSIFNWKSNKGTPEIRFMPAIIRFLGFNPLPEAATLAEQLVRRRTALGKSQKESALKLGVDAGTLATWERGEREPNSPRQISKTAENWRISKKGPFKFNGLQGRSAEPWRIGDFCHRQLRASSSIV
jgi:transcriptional regulator with XRE-family HTH domain